MTLSTIHRIFFAGVASIVFAQANRVQPGKHDSHPRIPSDSDSLCILAGISQICRWKRLLPKLYTSVKHFVHGLCEQRDAPSSPADLLCAPSVSARAKVPSAANP